MNIKEQIAQDLKDKKITYKPNSKSILYKYYDELDKNSDGTDKKYFEIDDLFKDPEINKYINLYLINSKKGIGKTYQMRKMMVDCNKRGKYFVFVRRIEPDIANVKTDWESMHSWPFFIKGKNIYYKKDKSFAGRVTTISTLYSETGLEFDNYDRIFFDEYKDKRGIKRYIENEFNKFIKFLIDVQRNKADLKIFMFANDETKFDPYTMGFNIDISTDYFIDLEAGIFYVNLLNKFKGAITSETVGNRLSMYSQKLKQELETNDTVFKDDTNILEFSQGEITKINYYFYLNKKLYVFGLNEIKNYFIIKSVIEKDNPLIPTYALTTTDYTSFNGVIRPNNIVNFTKTFYNLLYRKLVWFVDYDDKIEVEEFIKKVLGNFNKKR